MLQLVPTTSQRVQAQPVGLSLNVGSTTQKPTTLSINNPGKAITPKATALSIAKPIPAKPNGSPTPAKATTLSVMKPALSDALSAALSVGKAADGVAYPRATNYTHWDHRTWVYNKPDTYVGSDERFAREEWLYDMQNQRMVNVSIDFTPACERLFLEIITNASDNVGRSRRAGVNPGQIEVIMDNATISIKNYGLPVPIEMHPGDKVYVPQMIFGDLLTSSNYEVDRHEAGTNGIGAKATNIFSKEFMVIIFDHINKLKYTQIWRDNMLVCEKPVIEPYPSGPSSVQTIYKMDFERFKYPVPQNGQGGYPPEAFALFARHAIDISFTAKTKVIFNGQEFNMANIRDYARLYFGDAVDNAIVHYQWPAGTEVIRKKKGYQVAKNPAITPEIELIAIDTPDEGHHVSFVNCMMTRDGGVHVNAAIKAVGDNAVHMINDEMIKALTKRNKGKEIDAKQKRAHTININEVKPHISLLLAAKVMNPKFTSQTKTVLASPTPKITVTEEQLRPLQKWRLIERLYAALAAKQFANLAKADGKSRRHVKLKKGVDANNAGPGPKGLRCMLCLTEGDSGSTMANKISALMPEGRDEIGILEMRGKSLNVMDIERSIKAKLQYDDNREIKELKLMLGLVEGTDYTKPENLRKLRYGRVMIMADSDVDGKHITGLILLFFHCRFPSLLAQGFVMFYRTPILRVTHGATTVKFYTQREYDDWKAITPNWFDKKFWVHKYYKGLGSSSDKNIKEDFPTNRTVNCFYDEHAPGAMRLAFSRKMRDQRKEWISQWQPVLGIDDIQMQPISWFINHELILFSIADVQRSIPKLMDGFKESHRKVAYGAHLRWKVGPLNKDYPEFKVAQFGSHVADKAKYHHGETILSDVVVGMAQDFVGANNIAWFAQEGQFGTRRQGGKDAAQTRYSGTKPMPLFSYILRREDQPILTPVLDEGDEVEPEFYMPVVPMALINGANGIATGFATRILNHNPLDIIKWLRLKLNGVPDANLPILVPWYRGFTGAIKIFDRRRKKIEEGELIPIPKPKSDASPKSDTEAEDDKLESDKLEGESDSDSDREEEEEEEPEAVDGPKVTRTSKSRPLMSMVSYGKFQIALNGTIVVTELPIGRWSLTYRKWLEKLRDLKEITDFKDLCKDIEGDCKIYFEIYGFKGTPNYRTLHLQKTIGMSNMVLLNEHNRPVRYDTATDLIEAFYARRLPMYQQRKDYILGKISEDVNLMDAKIRFIRAVAIDKSLKIRNRSKALIYADMDRFNFPHELLSKARISNLSTDEIETLTAAITAKIAERDAIANTRPEQMWMNDLDEFETAYCKFYNIKKPGLSLSIAGKKPSPGITLSINPNLAQKAITANPTTTLSITPKAITANPTTTLSIAPPTRLSVAPITASILNVAKPTTLSIAPPLPGIRQLLVKK